MFRLTLAIAAFTLSSIGASTGIAQTAPSGGRPVEIGRSYSIRSPALHSERRINVYLPPDYGKAGKRFPVLYLLDGGEHEDFAPIVGLAQVIAAYGAGHEMIVVGIEGVDRRHDLTAPSQVASDLKAAPTSGGAAAYRRFLIDDLKPWVAAHFRSDGHSAIIGESLAGLFVLDTVLHTPTAFDDYIAVSPSLWWNGGRMGVDAAGLLRTTHFSGQRLWVGFETPEPPATEAAKERALQDRVWTALRSIDPPGLQVMVERLNEGHASVYHPAALQAFRALYPMPPRQP